MSDDIIMGDFVRSTRHNHTGRVYHFRRLTNEDSDWVKAQEIPVTIEEIQGCWLGILCHKGGSVLVPYDTCTKIPPIEGFSNPWNSEYFK